MRKAAVFTDYLQIAKAVIAGTGAWWVSVTFLESQTPFLAPWVALLTVHVTVTRSIVRGAQTWIASSLGVLLSSAIGVYLGVEVWTFALALAVGLIAARLPGIRREGTEIATTAIFLLAAGFTEDTPALVERVVEVGLGVGIGVLVNLLVMPPLRDAQASQTVDDLNQRMGAVMEQMGQDFAESWGTDRSRSWFEATEDMRNDLARSWDAVRFAEESRKTKPPSAAPPGLRGKLREYSLPAG